MDGGGGARVSDGALTIAVPPPASGAFGFVVLAEEVATKEKWAIKFLERGNKITKVWGRRGGRRRREWRLGAARSRGSGVQRPRFTCEWTQWSQRRAAHWRPGSPHGRRPTPTSCASQYVGRELVNHSRLLHPHIVQFREVFLTDKVRRGRE